MKTRGLFSWLAAGALTIACANGTTRSLDEEGTPKPAQTADPTDPSDPITLPPSQAGDDDDDTTDAGTADASDAGDAGKDASTTVDSGVDAGKDSGTPIVDAGGGCTTAAPSNACGVVPQCGCTATQTCDVTNLSTGAVSCVLAGGGPQGSYCTASNQCAKGTTCQGNACRPFCNNPGGTCATAGTGLCFAPQQSSGATTPNLNVCAITCDPRTPSAACGSNNCLWFSADKQSDCRSAGTVDQYGSCSTLVDCKQGLMCVDHPFYGYECEKWCRIGGNDCGIFDTCTDVYGANAPTSGGVKLGHCQ